MNLLSSLSPVLEQIDEARAARTREGQHVLDDGHWRAEAPMPILPQDLSAYNAGEKTAHIPLQQLSMCTHATAFT